MYALKRVARSASLGLKTGEKGKGSSELLKSYKELKVCQKSYQLCLEIYRITSKFSRMKNLGLIISLESRNP